MFFESFAALVAFLAVIYAIASRFVQTKMMDRAAMEAFQAESKVLSAEYDKAKKAGDNKKMEEVMQKQMEYLNKSMAMTLGSLKPMGLILGLFIVMTWLVGYIDPAVKDDIMLNMTDNGTGCDLTAGDGIYSACYTFNDTSYGKWTVTAKALGDGNAKLGSNSTYILYGEANASDHTVEGPQGEPILVAVDKQGYTMGETARITASAANAKIMEAVLDRGTSFRVDLPLTIPLINVKTIWQPYWWFILVSMISGLLISWLSKPLASIAGKVKR